MKQGVLLRFPGPGEVRCGGGPELAARLSNSAARLFFDIEVVDLESELLEFRSSRAWRAVEVWTRNHVYAVDSSMVCVDVISRQLRRPHEAHDLIGARLTGGRLRHEGAVELCQPLPLPGTQAIFELTRDGHRYFVTTSDVERVVLRLRVERTLREEQAAV